MLNLGAILLDVQKPLRYVGGEWNSIRKNPEEARIKIALVFPDAYEVGMSHLGIRILYDLLNRIPGYLVERVFSPWIDMEQQLRSRGLPLFSLENHLPVSSFDILGFSLQYELCYTNILTILNLGNIPLRSEARDLSHPLIIGGGPCASNPEPIADFMDAILIGEGEEALPELMEAYDQARRKFASLGGRAAKMAVLRELSHIPGWYVPSLYAVHTDPGTGLQFVLPPQTEKDPAEHPPFPIVRRFVEDLSRFPFPSDSIVPNTEVVHDRVAIEIARGCLEGCRFCQAGTIYRPLRERKPSDIVDGVLKGLESTGYDDASLTSLSTGDYRCIDPLVKTLMGVLEGKRVALSVSSLRADSLSSKLTEQIMRVRRTGFTIAPEAGTQRLRDAINKGITEQDVLQATRNAFMAGWSQLKMYFMIGLPTETMEDVDGIVELGKKALAEARAAGCRRMPDITISVSTFIPKPFAPFQWCPMEDQQSVERKQEHLRAALRKARLRFKWHEPEISILECVFSRGDRRLSRVIEKAWELGCRFDGWTEQLKMQFWQQAFEDCGVDRHAYIGPLPLDIPLPWDHLNSLVRKEWLVQEFRRALKSKASPACGKVFEKAGLNPSSEGPAESMVPCNPEQAGSNTKTPVVCYSCGLECDLAAYERMASDGLTDLESHYPQLGNRSTAAVALPSESLNSESRRYFASYTKTGILKYASHLDMIRLLPRTFYRAGIQLKHSQGFHPKPLFSFGPALSVGKESASEWLEFECFDTWAEEEFLERINAKAPEGLRFVQWRQVPSDAPSLGELIHAAEYSARPNASSLNGLISEGVALRIAGLLAQQSIEVVRQRREQAKTVDIRPGIFHLSVEPEETQSWYLRLILSTGSDHSVRPEEVLFSLCGSCGHPWEIRREILGTYKEHIVAPLELINPYRIGAGIRLHVKRANCQQQLP